MSCRMPRNETVSALRLCETAVTPCDCSIEKATALAYDGSLPTRVMSVPCSVVTVRGGTTAGAEVSIRSARYAAVACGTA